MTITKDKPAPPVLEGQGELFTREFCAGTGTTWQDTTTPDAADDAGKADS